MSFFTNLLASRVPENKTPPDFSDVDMTEIEAGQNSRALIVYNSKGPDNDAVTNTNPRNPRKHVPDKRQEPFSPSKRQYREIDKSIALREQNRKITATNENLLRQQLILTQQAEAAAQHAMRAEKQRENDYKEMSQRVEVAAQQVMQAQKQREQDLEAMRLAQEKFQEEMLNRFESDLAKLKVCLFFLCEMFLITSTMFRHRKMTRWQH
jgi:hypothetical protein